MRELGTRSITKNGKRDLDEWIKQLGGPSGLLVNDRG
jgi:hypothetical protein